MKTLRTLTLILTSLLIVAMAAGTFIERAHGHDTATATIYHVWWFIALWGALSAMGVFAIVKWKMWRRFWLLLLHISLLLILLGALLSHLTSHQGSLHIRQGSTADFYFPTNTDQALSLPFSLRLDTFMVAYTTGTGMQRDFHSQVSVFDKGDTIHADIRMNHILSRRGYRFYQTSYDPDFRGTILTVSYDPWGLPLTYVAYALLGLSIMGIMVSKLLKRRKANKSDKILAAIVLTICTLPLHARQSIPTVNAEEAAKMERLQVSGEDRVMPLGTLSRDFLLTLYGKPSYRGLTAMQVLAGWTLRPDAWKDQPMIRIKNQTLRQRLGINDGQHATFAQLFSANGNYRVEPLTADTTPEPLRKAAIELDEKVGLILMATRGELVRPAPTDAKVSEARVTSELLYNRLPKSLPLFICSFMLAVLLFLPQDIKEKRLFRSLQLKDLLHIALFVIVVYHTALYFLRWYIGGRIPLGNGPETMLFMALCLLWTSLLSIKRQPLLTAPALMMGGFALLVAHLSESQPRIGGLMPVLQSPLLTIHVSVIMTAYALLALTCILSVLWLITRQDEFTTLTRSLLMPAVFLLSAGIFLGAVWAGVSWGAYWSWDPKEVWALITLLVYALPLHTQSLPKMRSPRVYHLYIMCAFFAVLFTYFGVNYLIGGMHSYA